MFPLASWFAIIVVFGVFVVAFDDFACFGY
jgi:hypothetical protein